MSRAPEPRAETWQPPAPPCHSGEGRLTARWRLAAGNILAALPRRLFRAWMAETRTPLGASYLLNQPEPIAEVLSGTPANFPKHPLYRRALGDLLGESIFVSRPGQWARQRRLIEPAFANGRLAESFLPMAAACDALIARLRAASGPVEIEREASAAAADVIFRALFSMPIDRAMAGEVFAAFRAYQAAAPMVSPAGLWVGGGWSMALGFGQRLTRRGRTRLRAARAIRRLLDRVIDARAEEIRRGAAPDDFATALMLAVDPRTGRGLKRREIADQLAVFFLAGHETSAAALSWSLYLIAGRPALQTRLRDEADRVFDGRYPRHGDIGRLHLARDVFRETLRLYPPVPFLLRQARCPLTLRGRRVRAGSAIVASLWHLHRHERIWQAPHAFDPDRWRNAEERQRCRGAFLPFSAGPRACIGAGFALQEGVLFLARIAQAFRIAHAEGAAPEPVAQLTLRSRSGVRLVFDRRAALGLQVVEDEEANG